MYRTSADDRTGAVATRIVAVTDLSASARSPGRDRDEDMHLADGEGQQSVVESNVSPSPSQESTGSALP